MFWSGGAHLRISFWRLLMNFETSEKSEFWKNEKNIAGDIIILNMCTKSHNHMKYSSWDMEFDRFSLLFWTTFYPFTPPPNKSGNKSFEKSICRCHSLNLCNKNHYHMMYAYSDMESSRQFCYFKRAIFCSFTPLLTRKLKYKKNVKNPWRYYPFTHVYHKSRSYDV